MLSVRSAEWAPAQLLGQLEPVHRVDPVEEPRRVPGLVGLEPADQVPGHRTAERLDLLARFLDAVLSQGRDTCRDGHPDTLGVHRLGDRDEEHVVGGATGSRARSRHSLLDAPEVGAYVQHEWGDSSTPARAAPPP